MRIVLAFVVMGWVVNLVIALASRDASAIGFCLFYLVACVYGLFLRGLALGIVAWVVIGIGLEILFLAASHQHVPALVLLPVLFWSALAILAGNLFRSD